MNIEKQIRKMDDEKLERELVFAQACKDEDHPENLAWLKALQNEAKRRGSPWDVFTEALERMSR